MVSENMPSRTSDRVGDREAPRAEHKERRKHRHQHRSSRSKNAATKDERENTGSGEHEADKHMANDVLERRPSTDVPEIYGRGSPSSPMTSRSSLPYPSFSKAHSREAVNSRDDLSKPPRKNIFTPDPTDLQQQPAASGPPIAPKVPPSPPLTADSQAHSSGGLKRGLGRRNEDAEKAAEKSKQHTGSKGSSKMVWIEAEETSSLNGSSASPMRKTRSMTPVKGMPMPVTVDDGSTVLSGPRRTKSISPASSNRTSIAPEQPKMQAPYSPTHRRQHAETAEQYSPPKTPTPRGTPVPPAHLRSPSMDAQSVEASPMSRPPPPPPPPPPLPVVSGDVQRVDYLLQHGGLSRPITKHYLSAPDGNEGAVFAIGGLPDPTAMAQQVDKFFSPFSRLLDDYDRVISKNGSIAVATGYKSIARRLLSRLEAVFARNISSEFCSCVLCTIETDPSAPEADTGVSWGEILEYVSGREELPPWPPLTLHSAPASFGPTAADFKAPMQKLDIDVPEEYREHYIRQSRKTKQSVDRWLAGQTDTVAPPDEADDDTLTFAVLTHLTSEERRLFSRMVGLPSSRPPSVSLEAQTSSQTSSPNQEVLTQTGVAIQRLYRLSSKPRQPECALYLLRNVGLHGVLATLAAISDAEWEILISGRFDGFLISGAEDPASPSLSNTAPSRGHTPANPRRSSAGLSASTTPVSSSTGAPVAMDEETEIATLAEVEREIFLGMETLEDAFEALHTRAEVIRRNLRERAAGLAMQSQLRKGATATAIEARLGTPASQKGFDSETDDGMDDAISELAPDDSASNISRSRMRRPRRRTERRTPALVEEKDEEDDGAGRGARTSHTSPADVHTPSRNTPRKR